jgi:hypothetical protein
MKYLYNQLAKIISYIAIKFNLRRNITNKLVYSVGINGILSNNKFYENFKNINESELKIYSQNGEDGIIDFLLYKIKVSKPNFIEIGVGEYIESNTRFLYERFYQKGLIIDCINDLEKKVFSNVNQWKGDLKVVENFVTSKNINSLIFENCNFDVDLFSIDIDGTDYWVINKLKSNFSKIFIGEYNAIFGDKFDISVPDIENFNRESYHYSHLCYGMSLRALIRIMKEKGFYFIGTNNFKNNAFFINDLFPKDEYFSNFDIIDDNILTSHTNSIYKESRNKFGELNFLSGNQRLDIIKNCEIIDFTSENGTLKKIKDLKDYEEKNLINS